jgi:hypothetical protein
MGFLDTFYIITGVAFVVIPIIIILIKLKDKKNNFSEFIRYFSIAVMIYIIPFTLSSNIINSGVNDKEFLITMLWIIVGIAIFLGLISGLVYYFIIKKSLKENSKIISFIYSLGITGGYASCFYIVYGIFLKYLLPLYKDSDNLSFIITLFEYPFVVYVIDLVLYLGHFFNIFTITIILKYNLNKIYIILLIIFQSVLYPLHLAYVSSYIIGLIIVIILMSIIEIILGIIIYIKYGRNKIDENEIDSNTFKLNAI